MGWWRVAQISHNNVYDIKLKQTYNTNFPAEMKVVASVGYMTSANAVLSLAGGYLPNRFTPSKIRVCGNTTACYIDIYTADVAWNTTVVEIKGGPGSSISQTEFSFIGTSDTVDDYNVVILDLVSGTNTTGQIYQQGAPVFATDPSKLEPSTANGWTQISNTGSLPSTGVYLISTIGGDIGILVADNGWDYSCLLPGSANDYEHLNYNAGRDEKWRRYTPSGQQIVTTAIYYKRIA